MILKIGDLDLDLQGQKISIFFSEMTVSYCPMFRC